MKWRRLCSSKALNCKLTLLSGQCFNWKLHPRDSSQYIGTLFLANENVVIALHSTPDAVHYRLLATESKTLCLSDLEKHLHHYFRLDMDLDLLMTEWTKCNDSISQTLSMLPGFRLLRQDPLESFFAFLNSSNSTIQRNTALLRRLRKEYGACVYKDDVVGQEFGFPSLETLVHKATESHLRELGFGYRSKFFVQAADQLLEKGGRKYFENIRQMNHMDMLTSLCEFQGVGLKVADCIAMSCCDQLAAIPVDTHVWQIACRDFDPSLKQTKSLTPRVYHRVGDCFRKRFPTAGAWAHCILFAAELKPFQPSASKSTRKRVRSGSAMTKPKKDRKAD